MNYIAQLAALTEEEQRIRCQPRIEREDQQRLKRIATARELLWNAQRAARVGAPLADVPVNGWPVDHASFRMPRPRRQGPKAPKCRDLPRGVERTRSGRIRAVVYRPHASKVSLGTFEPTPAGIARAARAAAAARAARDAGGNEQAIRAAAEQAAQEI